MIQGIEVKDLVVHADERGRVMEMVRCDDSFFKKFGQVYMSTTLPGVVKGWHYHEKQFDYVCCVSGMIKLATFDERDNSPTKGEVNQFYLGNYSPKVIVVPPRVWHGWKCVSEGEAIIINTVTEIFNREKPDEHRIDPHENHIPYSWERKDG